MPAMLSAPRFLLATKIAAGDIQTFENSLATIGRSFLGPKAPQLFKHEIGFQILDSDDDNTRAVGVFGFRVGKRLLYVPVFYRDGRVKGTEQLRDPKRKVCVPLSDNWVNKFLHEQGDQPALKMPRTANKDNAQPSLWQLKYPPSKYASEDLTLIQKDLARAIAREMGQVKQASAADDFDLIRFAQDHPVLLEAIGDLAVKYAWFGDALQKFHGREKIAQAMAQAKPVDRTVDLFAPVYDPRIVPPTAKQAAESALTVVRVTTVRLRHVGQPGGPKVEALYDPAEWEDLRVGKNIYRDKRGPENKSKVTLWVGGSLSDGETLSNPSEHGVYEVLGNGHEYYKCAVLTPLVGWGPAIGRCLVYRLSDGAWCYAHPNAVWVRGQADQPELRKWVESLPAVKAKVDGVPQGTHAAIARVTENPGAGGFEATVPWTKHDGDSSECWPMSPPTEDRPFWGAFDPWMDRTDGFRGKAIQSLTSKGPTIHDTSRKDQSHEFEVEVFDECSRPVVHGHQLYLPVDCYLIKLDDKRFRPGDGSDPERVLFARNHSAGDKKVELEKMAYSWHVQDPRDGRTYRFKEGTDLEAHLVESHGLSVDDAQKLMSRLTQTKRAVVQIKYAADYRSIQMPDTGLALNFPGAPTLPFDQVAAPASFADDVVPSETGSSVSVPIQDMLMQPGAPDRYRPYPVQHGVQTRLPGIGNDDSSGTPGGGPTDKDLQAVATTADGDRRDLFDTASLATLVKHKRLDTLLSGSRNKLGAAVTELGDDLAHLYWNTDEWAEKFGEGEIGPLEDQMLSQFEKLGELVLTMQEKTIDDTIDPGILPTIAPSDASEQGD